MKLAEALQKRSDLQIRLEELRTRLINNATHQEGVEPVEDVLVLKAEIEENCRALADLIYRINLTNSQSMTEEGSLTKVLAERDALKIQRSLFLSLAEAASDISPRYSKTEIKVLPSLDVKSLQKELDEQAKRLRELELLIQEVNWTVDLL